MRLNFFLTATSLLLLQDIVTTAAAAAPSEKQKPLFGPGDERDRNEYAWYGNGEDGPLDEEFRKDVEWRLEHWRVPGLAIGVVDVKAGKEWFAGYGHASLSPPHPVTPDSLFLCASTTKAFTAATFSRLVDDPPPSFPSLTWSTPIHSILPDFELPSPHLTFTTTFEDALSHRTGIGRHDLAYGTGVCSSNSNSDSKSKTDGVLDEEDERCTTPESLVHTLRHLPMTASPRTKMHYSNLMYITVSLAISRLTSLSYPAAVFQKILSPLNMKSTFFDIPSARKAASTSESLNLAEGYNWIPERGARGYNNEEHEIDPGYGPGNGSFAVVPDFVGLPEISGAGSIISSVRDYAKWVSSLLLASPPLSPAGHAAIRFPRTIIDSPAIGPFAGGVSAYALGWIVGTFHGYQVYWHTGGLTGYSSLVVFVPELGVGVVGLGNSATAVFVAEEVLWGLLEQRVGVGGKKKGEKKDEGKEGVKNKEEKEKATGKGEGWDWQGTHEQLANLTTYIYTHARALYYPPSTLPSPPLPLSLHLESYTGTYFHPGYHNVTFFLHSPPSPSPSSSSSSSPHHSSQNPSSSEATQILRANRTQTLYPTYYELEHVSGDFFLVKIDSLVAPGGEFLVRHPAEFRIGVDGRPSAWGARLEPLMGGEKIWFERVGD